MVRQEKTVRAVVATSRVPPPWGLALPSTVLVRAVGGGEAVWIGVDRVMGVGAALGAPMYCRRGSGLGGRAIGSVCAASGMYGPWRRVMPAACVSTQASGAAHRGRSRGPHCDAVSGGGVVGRTRGPHCGSLVPSYLTPSAQTPAPEPSLSTLSLKAEASSSMSMGSLCQYHLLFVWGQLK